MKSLLIVTVVLLSFSNPSANATQDSSVKSIVRTFLESQEGDPNSEMHLRLMEVMTNENLPSDSEFVLAGPSLLQEGPRYEEQKCNPDCVVYEIHEFRQISDLRWRSEDRTQIKLWVLGIYLRYAKGWTADGDGTKRRPIGEKTTIEAIHLL